MTTYLFAHLLAGTAILLAVVEALAARLDLAAHRDFEAHVADALALGSRGRHPSARGPR